MQTTCKCTSGESMSQSANKSDDDVSEHRIAYCSALGSVGFVAWD